MEMHQIRYFLAVSRTLNFTRAAEACHVTQPALTRAIQLLEAELGGDLFRRERGFTHLTELGKRLLPTLQRCYDSAVEVKQSAESYAKSGGVSLEIAIADGIGLDLLAPYLGLIARELPTIDVSLRRGSAEDAVAWLKKGDVELAIAADLDDKWARIDRWQLSSQRYSVVASSANGLSGLGDIALSVLAGERLLAIPGCDQAGVLIAEVGADAITQREVPSVADIIPLVQANLGITILPDRMNLPTGLVRLNVSGIELRSDFGVYAVAGRQRSKAARLLIKALPCERRSSAAQTVIKHEVAVLDAAQ